MKKLCCLFIVLIPISLFCQKTKPMPSPQPAGGFPTTVIPITGANGPWIVTATSKGTYSSSTFYASNDLIIFSGDNYISMSSLNQGNQPSPTSTFWLRLPNFSGTISMAAWGMDNNPAPVIFSTKQFSSATSYTCALTSDLLVPPAPPTPLSPPVPTNTKPSTDGGNPIPQKPQFKYISGQSFSIDNLPTNPTGYVCAGN